MTSENTEKEKIMRKINDVESRLRATDDEVYRIAMERKMLNHQLSDLVYNLKEKGLYND